MDKLVLKGLSKPWLTELKLGFNTLGRNPTNDFRIPDASVSSFHCEIIVSEDSILVRDLGSTNGTFIDHQPIQESVIQPGQTVQLGSAEFRLEAEPAPAEVHIAIPPRSAPQPPAPQPSCLRDGSPGCLNHPGTPAIYKCTQCQSTLCVECVRGLGRPGATPLIFCSACNGQCEDLATPAPRPSKATKGKSILGRLKQTLKIRFKH
jgi:hypothetical protein